MQFFVCNITICDRIRSIPSHKHPLLQKVHPYTAVKDNTRSLLHTLASTHRHSHLLAHSHTLRILSYVWYPSGWVGVSVEEYICDRVCESVHRVRMRKKERARKSRCVRTESVWVLAHSPCTRTYSHTLRLHAPTFSLSFSLTQSPKYTCCSHTQDMLIAQHSHAHAYAQHSTLYAWKCYTLS